MSDEERMPTEEELRAAMEEQLRNLRVEDLIGETVVSMINLAARRAGLVPGTEGEADPAQVRMAIEAVRALLPFLEGEEPERLQPLKDAVSQLQLAYARMVGQPGESEPAPEPPKQQEGSGPAQSSGRLWVPGQ